MKVSERTLYRDIAELIGQGAPIQGEAGIGYVLKPGLFLPPLMLGEDETEAIVLGLRYVDQRGDAVLARAARNALSKIAAVLPPAAREALDNPVVMPGPRSKGFPADGIALDALRSAIRRQAKLEIAYRDTQKTPTKRVVWPIAIGFTNEARVMLAWCETRNDYRVFRTDRIASSHEVGERYPGRRSALLRSWMALHGEAADGFAPDKT